MVIDFRLQGLELTHTLLWLELLDFLPRLVVLSLSLSDLLVTLLPHLLHNRGQRTYLMSLRLVLFLSL